MFTVKVQAFPGGTEEFNSDEPITVQRAIQLAKIANPENWSARIGGEVVSPSKVISSDTSITLLKTTIKGNA